MSGEGALAAGPQAAAGLIQATLDAEQDYVEAQQREADMRRAVSDAQVCWRVAIIETERRRAAWLDALRARTRAGL